MPYYRDLRDFLTALDRVGKLVRVRRPVNKDTELHPLVRLQFRGLPEEERRAFLFENVTDSRQTHYRGAVATCAAAPTTEIYGLGLMCRPAEIADKWIRARRNPIAPVVVTGAPSQAEIHVGAGLLEHGGLAEFPITISTPGYDAGPYFTAPCWVSKDPETGSINVGTYRAQVKSATRTGLMLGRPTQHMAQHWAMCRKLGKPLQAALVQGVAPNINYVSVAKLAYGENEFAVAGGLTGTPVELVKCLTVDLEVPAWAEIVIEGEVSVTETEPEGPFGETFGYMESNPVAYIFEAKCITHRKDPVVQSFFSEFPPSESTKVRSIARGAALYKVLRHDLGMTHVKSVAIHEDTAAAGVVAVSIVPNTDQAMVWEALERAFAWLAADPLMVTKLVIAVDDDIDPHDAGMVNWAMSFRMQPHRDVRIRTYAAEAISRWGTVEPSLLSPQEVAERALGSLKEAPVQSKMLINATMKWDYPPLSLPKKEYMDNALRMWHELGLPSLKLREPWWGHQYARWSKDNEEMAGMAVLGDWRRVGDIMAGRRHPLE